MKENLDRGLFLSDELELDVQIQAEDDSDEEFVAEIQGAEEEMFEELHMLHEHLERQIQCSISTGRSLILHNFENNNTCTVDIKILLHNNTDNNCLVSVNKIDPDNMTNVSYLTASTNNESVIFAELLILPNSFKEMPLCLVISSPGIYYMEDTFQCLCFNDLYPHPVDQVLKDACVLYVIDSPAQN